MESEVMEAEVLPPAEQESAIANIARVSRSRARRGGVDPETGGNLIEIDDDSVNIGKYFEFTPSGLYTKGKPAIGVFTELMKMLHTFEVSIQFAIGDAINYAESMFGEEAAQIIDSEKWTEATVRNYAWVAAKVDKTVRRMDKLDFSHHQVVGGMETSQQKLWLDRAAEGEEGVPWTRARLKAEISHKVGTASAPSYTVTVTCESAADVEAFCRQLENLGRINYKKHIANDPSPALAAAVAEQAKPADGEDTPF